jgi:hypothetical protein
MKRRFLTIFAAILIAASLASCGGGTEEESTSGNKININIEETTEEKSGNATTEEITEKQEETTQDQQGSVVDRNSDPGEFTYIDQNDTVYVINKSNNLPFRSGTFEYLGEFKNGTALRRTGISEDGRWSRIVAGGIEGYVATRNITTYNPRANDFEPTSLTLTAAATINVRISPNLPVGIDPTDESEVYINVAGQIFEGTTVTVVAHDAVSGWYKISYTPAEGILTGEYNYEFFVKAENDYFVETKEEETTEEVTTEEPAPEIVIPEGYSLKTVEGISFALPDNITSFSSNLFIGGNNVMISVVKDTYTDTYYSDFVSEISSQVAAEGASHEETKQIGDITVAIVYCISGEGTGASFDTLICVRTSETECVNITITELGAQSDIVEVILDTLSIK